MYTTYKVETKNATDSNANIFLMVHGNNLKRVSSLVSLVDAPRKALQQTSDENV